MGFRSGAYATVWEVKPISDTKVTVRLSITHKDKNTGDYIQDFSNFVGFFGKENAAEAKKLKRLDRIKLGDVDVVSSRNPNGETRLFFNVFSFELVNSRPSKSPESSIDDGEVEIDEDSLPF